jgi:tyrosine-protein phosphatase SIW14
MAHMTFSGKSVQFLRAAVISCVLAYPAQALPKDHALEPAASASPKLDIFNFGQVSPSYFRGGELKGSSASTLAARGVKLVIDLRGDGDVKAAEAKLVADAGMKYIRIPMNTRVAPTSQQISQFMALVTNPANQPVYVHCVEGRHRTGVMTAIYRMNVDGWTADRAFGEMKDYKFGMDFLHPEFKKFVFSYQPTPGTDKPAGTTLVAEADKPVVAGDAIAGAKLSGEGVVVAAEKNAVAGEKTIVPVAAVKTID